MRFTSRARYVALAGVCATVALNCGLINSLDHLQSGADASSDAPNLPVGDGEAAGESGADGPVVDADDAPGCGPSEWDTCGVTRVATPVLPGDAVFALSSVYFSDEATGEVFETTCKSDGCTTPELRAAGEDKPKRMAYVQNSVFWTTPTAIRRLKMIPYDAATPVETIDTTEGPTDITGKYPHTMWTDAKGVRGWPLQGGLVTLWGKPSSSPSFGTSGALFVSEGQVKRCSWDTGGPGAVSAVPGSTDATLVAWNLVSAQITTGFFGTVAAVPQAGGGSRLLVLDQLDDAGAPSVFADDPSPIVSIDSDRESSASEKYVYWTNEAGELRRRAKDATTPASATVLRGLSNDTRIDVKNSLVLITDRGGNKILSFSPP